MCALLLHKSTPLGGRYTTFQYLTLKASIKVDVASLTNNSNFSRGHPVVFIQSLVTFRVDYIGINSVFHNECPNFKTLHFCNHEPQMNETCTT
jgi:hypothetical protein